MDQYPVIVFVCEHGAAKSIIAAAYFNKLAEERGLTLRAFARGTNPDHELSARAVQGLSQDGLAPTEVIPRKLTASELRTAQLVVAFCELPAEYDQQAILDRWENVPPVSENYERARDTILERIHNMLNQ